MMKHTKEPWIAGEVLSMEGMYHIFIKADGNIIARVDGHKDGNFCGTPAPDKAETVANAQIMAAAPKAIRLLRDLYDYEDEKPAEGTYGAEIYGEIKELLESLTVSVE